MPVSRGTHEALKTAHAALKQKHKQTVNELDTHRRADTSAADTITRLSGEAVALRRIVAHQVHELEVAGLTGQASDLRRQLANAGIDLVDEYNEAPTAVPARRQFTAAESRLIADAYRARKAAGAFEDRCLELQRVNEEQARQLREYATAPVPVEGSAA